MFKHVLTSIAAVLLTGSVSYAGTGGDVPFGTDWDKGFAQAKKTRKPIVVYFGARW